MSEVPTKTEQVKKRYATPTYERYDRRKRIVRDLEGEFDAWLQSVKADAWDEAVASLVYEDGTPLEVVKNINPYREADG